MKENEVLEEMSDFFNSRAQIYDQTHLEHVGGIECKNIIASFFPPDTNTMIDLGVGTGLELEAIFENRNYRCGYRQRYARIASCKIFESENRYTL